MNVDRTGDGAAAVKGALGLRRRPSGEPPPLPRPVWWTKLALTLAGTVLVGLAIGLVYADEPPDGTAVVGSACAQLVLDYAPHDR